MSSTVEILVEFRREDYQRIISRLELLANRSVIRKAIYLAADRAADHGVTEIKRGIAREYTIPKGRIGAAVKKYRYGSAVNGMSIGIRLRDTARPLSDFKYSPTKPSRKPVFAEIKRGSNKPIPAAFVTTVGSDNHVGPMLRVPGQMMKEPYKYSVGRGPYSGKGRQAIRTASGPSVTGMFKANEPLYQGVWNIIFDSFGERFEHEVERLLNA